MSTFTYMYGRGLLPSFSRGFKVCSTSLLWTVNPLNTDTAVVPTVAVLRNSETVHEAFKKWPIPSRKPMDTHCVGKVKKQQKNNNAGWHLSTKSWLYDCYYPDEDSSLSCERQLRSWIILQVNLTRISSAPTRNVEYVVYIYFTGMLLFALCCS